MSVSFLILHFLSHLKTNTTANTMQSVHCVLTVQLRSVHTVITDVNVILIQDNKGFLSTIYIKMEG